ncbi:MAG: hypothetical protein KGL63_05870 [Betaproteobacteria bacterium]|nr:hypothetical protein [Betaproteobacteria bacterium]
MDLLIATNSVPLANADEPPVAGTPQYATDGDAASNVPPTIWPAYWFNGLLQELVGGLIKGAGIIPAATNFGQIAQSIRRYAGGNITKIAATTTLTADAAGLILVDASGGNVALTLPEVASANGIPLSINIIRTDTSANAVTYFAQGTDTFSPSGSTSGSVPIGGEVEFIGDGVSAWWRPARGRLLNVQILTASGQYTKTPGAEAALILGCGGGGGGGSVIATSNAAGAGGGGGSGAAGLLWIPQGLADEAVVIGSGGAGGVNGNSGTDGGESSFGANAQWPGGTGGGSSTDGNTAHASAAGGPGGLTPVGITFGSNGAPGEGGFIFSATSGRGGSGANSLFGGGAIDNALSATGSSQGANGNGYGSGGAGGISVNSSAASGGNGAPGCLIVIEFS